MISKFTARILLISLFGVFLQIVPTPAQAATLTDYGLNYKSAYFTVNGGLSPNGGNFQVDTWFRINEWNSTHGEHAVIIGNSGTNNALIVKIQGTNQVYFGQANISARVFTCSTTWALETWYQLTAVQDANGQLAWINGASCGDKQSRGTYVGANQLGGQSNPLRLNQNTDISSFRFMHTPAISTNSSTITPPTYPLSSVANTTFLFNPQSVSSSMTDTIGYDLTKAGTGTITRSQVVLIQQNLLLGASKTSLRYDQTATLSTSGSSGTGAITYSPSGSCTVTGNVLKATGSSGNCTVSATIAADSVYAEKTSNILTIPLSKGDQQSTMFASQVTSSAAWNGSAYTAVPTFSTGGSPGTGAVTYTVANGTASGCTLSSNTLSTATLTATTSGTCTITATKAASTNYDGASVQLTFTFNKASSSTGLAISNSLVTYGSAVTLTANVSPSTATGTFSFSNNGTPISGCTAAPISAGAATCTTWKPAVGTYTSLTATYSGATNFLTSVSSDSISLQITRAPLTVTASSPTVIYGDTAPSVTASYSGLVNSDASSVVTGLICSTAYTTTSEVGSLPSTSCSGGSADNYSISYVSGAVTVGKATPTISLALPASATTATYGTAVTITATVSKPGTVTFKSGGTAITGCTAVTATTTATCNWTPSASNANTVLTGDFLPTDSTNFSNLTAAGSLTINAGKAVLSITASSHTVAFGDAIPGITPSYSGFVNGDTSSVVTGLTCTTTYTTSTSVGTTGSSCSGGSATNYTISYTPGVVTITQGGQTSALTVSSTIATYGSTLSLTTTGGNGSGSISFVVDSGPCTVSGSTLSSTDTGTCMVTATKAASGNYLAASSTSTAITVGKATPTTSLALPASATTATYGTAVIITATVSTPGTVTFKVGGTAITGCTAVTATTTATCNWTPSAVNASTSLTADFAPTDSANYADLNAAGSLTINVGKAVLSITASSHSVTYGAAVPEISPAYSGFVNGDTSSVVTAPTCSTTYTTTTAVGLVATSCSGASATNYSFTYTQGVITIGRANQANLSVANQSFWAHQTQFPSSWIPTGGSGTGALTYSVTSGPCTISAGVLSGNPTGPNGPKVCTLTVTKAADTNYNAITSASFTATMAFSFSRIGLALPSAATTATYGTPVVITATSFGQIPGTISFRAAGQLISGCTNQLVTAAPWTTTCTWTPSASGATNLTYDWTPSEPDLYDTKTNWTPYKLSTDSLGTTTPVTITVAKISTTILLTLSSSTSTYGTINTITATVSAPGTVAFKSSGTDIAGCSSVATTLASPYTAACPWTPTGVASYSLTAVLTPTDTAAYLTATSTALTPTSVKSPITITPTPGLTKVFGTQNPPLTYSISSGALVLSDTLSGELAYVGSDAGSYTITLGTLTNANNPKYEITLASETFTITKALQSAVSLSSLSSAYNTSNKTISLTGSGGTGTGNYQYALDSSNTTPGCSVSGSTLTYTTAGTCVVAVTRTSDTNYLARTDVVSFSIGLASQTITFGSLSAKNYSAETFTVSATTSASLTVVFTSASQSVCTTSGTSGNTITLLNVGTCVINANQIGDSNVAPASQVSQIFTVNPRAITVTADAKTKVYGAAEPTFTYTITTGSLVLGDAITGALTRAAGTDVGAYQIQQGALTTANNPKYAITFVAADLSITRATPTLVLTYPNSNVAILRPGAVNTPTVTTSSSSGTLTFATRAASSICTVDTATGVISLFGAGSCAVAMTTAITTNFIQQTETTTVTVALLSTSLVGINQSNLVSMGQPFFAHASVDQAYSFSSGNNGASVAIPAGALDPLVPISIHLLTDSADQREMIGGTGTSVLSVVVSWVAPDGSVPNTNAGKAISVTLTNPDIKKDAKIYSIIGNQSKLLGTATADGSVTTLITEDPVLLVINPVVTTPVPSTSRGSVGGGSTYVDPTPIIDPSIAAAAKALADAKAAKAAEAKAAADAKALAEKKAAEEAELLATLKAAQEKADAEALAAAKRVQEELAAAQLKADEELKAAAALKLAEEERIAAERAAAAKRITTVYSTSAAFKLNKTYTKRLNTSTKKIATGSTVTCIGYAKSSKTLTYAKAKILASKQAKALCSSMKKINPTLKTKSIVHPASKAPKTTVNKKWIPVSYRVEAGVL